MRNVSSDVKILVAVVAAIIVLSMIAVLTVPVATAPPLSIHSTAPDGAMALQLWLSKSGYQVRELAPEAQLTGIDVLFLLNPGAFYSEQDGKRLRNWIQGGHILIIATESLDFNMALKAFGLRLAYGYAADETARPSSPGLHWPPFSAITGQSSVYIEVSEPSVVNHLYAGNYPVLVSQELKRGRLWLSSALQPFTNRGLHDTGNAALIANLMAGIPQTAIIAFAEGEAGFGLAPAQHTLFQWLSTTPPGLGILFGCALTLTYLASQGRRFGRAIPLPDDRLRRESAEYIYAMATLFRRSGQRAEVIAHYNQRLRRHLAERYGAGLPLESAELVKTVIYHDPSLDEVKLRHLLASLSQSDISEQELVNTALELDQFLRNIP